MEELISQIREERDKTGRRIEEIIDAMRDEGYLDLTDDEAFVLAETVGKQ